MAKEGVLLQTEMMWRYLWEYAKNKVQKVILAKKQDSNAKKRGHETRTKKVLDTKCEMGSEFDSKDQKYRARKEVM